MPTKDDILNKNIPINSIHGFQEYRLPVHESMQEYSDQQNSQLIKKNEELKNGFFDLGKIIAEEEQEIEELKEALEKILIIENDNIDVTIDHIYAIASEALKQK